MRNLKKFYAIAVVVAMLVAMMAPAVFAAGTTATAGDYSDAAKALYDLGLYKGISDKDYQPDLDATLDRQTAATMVLRLFGEESKALAMDVKDAKNILAKKFTDASTVADWAVKQVAYAVDNDVIKGFPDGTFQPKGLVTGKQYNTLVLKLLGYTDFTFDQAGAKFAKVAGLEAADQDAFDVAGPIKKNILVGISRKALDAKPEGSDKTLAQQLITDGVLDATKAKTILGITAPTAAPSTSANPSASSTAGAAYNGVEVTATASPALMAKNVDDFTFLNLGLKNGNTQDVSFSQFSIAMDRFTGTNTKVADIKIWEGDTKRSVGTARWSGSTYTAVINLTTPMLIKANETKNLRITADVGNINQTGSTYEANLGEIYKFTVTDVQFAGSPNMPVKGIPLAGPAVQVSTVSAATTLDINDETKTGSQEQMAIGGRAIEVGNFKLTAPDDEKITVNSIRITNAGNYNTRYSSSYSTASSSKIDSIELYNGTALLGSAPADQYITFATPLVIQAGTNVILTVKLNTTTDLVDSSVYTPSVNDVSDITAVGDKFGETIKLKNTWIGRSTFAASGAALSVTGVGQSQSTTALQGSNSFKLGTIFVKNNNVEDVKISDLKANIASNADLTVSTGGSGSASLSNFRLVVGSNEVARLNSLPSTSGANITGTDQNDYPCSANNGGAGAHAANYVLDFSINNEYLIPKNTEVAFDVYTDVSSNANTDATSVRLQFYQNSVSYPHLYAVGQSSGTQLYVSTSNVLGNVTAVTGSAAEYIAVAKDSNWDFTSDTTARAIAAGTGRVVASWKMGDSSLNEDANVKYLELHNEGATGTSPEAYYMSNFELYYDGVKVATANSMGSDWSVKFGTNSSTANTLFTVKDGDTGGKSLVVKCDISDNAVKNSEINFSLIGKNGSNTGNLLAIGASTSGQIYAYSPNVDAPSSGSIYAYKNTYGSLFLKDRYATFTKVANAASTTVAAGSVATVLRFTITPEPNKVVNLSDMAITLADQLGTGGTNSEIVSVYDETNQRAVPLLANGTGTTPTTDQAFTLADIGKPLTFNEPLLNGLSSQITLAIRVATRNNGSSAATAKSYQYAVKSEGNHLMIISNADEYGKYNLYPNPSTTTPIPGFAALGDSIVGDQVTTTN